MEKTSQAGRQKVAKTGTKKSQGFKNTHAYELRFRADKKNLQKTAVLDRVCSRCYEILQWKLTYGKYRPLKKAKKCQKCKLPAVLKPYRVLCNKCGDESKCCTKCGKNKEYTLESYQHAPKSVVNRRVQEMKNNMKMMQERSKRKITRMLLDDLIRFREGKFLYKEDMSVVDGIYYKKKYWGSLGIEDPTDIYGADYNP